jgi:probable phosphoglycerate mutase
VRLLLARHGATQNNFDARFTGQSDIPLSPLGERQAQALARRLSEECLSRIVSSDLQRARRTAEIVAARVGLPVELDRDLREIALGAWEGRTHAELEAEAPDDLRRWRRDAPTWAPPGGETYAALRTRLWRALTRWQEAEPDGTVVWVTHGAAIGVLLCDVVGIELTRGWQFRRDNAAISELDVGPERIVVARLNDAAHLAGVAEGERVERFQVM